MLSRTLSWSGRHAWSFEKQGFTLIELLMVVAIIAVLAAVAVPNFLEAQSRAKVARTKADLRTIGLAIESYFADQNRYPTKPSASQADWLALLTTPVAYVSGKHRDVFCPATDASNLNYQYSLCVSMKSWILVSVGPDTVDSFDETKWMCGMAATYPPYYDATNGTVSRGDVLRLSKQGGTPPCCQTW